jgi:hypothetical protein
MLVSIIKLIEKLLLVVERSALRLLSSFFVMVDDDDLWVGAASFFFFLWSALLSCLVVGVCLCLEVVFAFLRALGFFWNALPSFFL